MIVIGIDPGYAIVGYGVLKHEGNRFTVLDFGRITTGPDTPFALRLLSIHEKLQLLFGQYSPDCVAIEQLYFNTNTKTAISVAQGRGAILLTAAMHGAAIYEYTPLQVKMAVTGYGQADKDQIRYMVKILLNLRDAPKSDDVADALAVAVCHSNTHGIENAARANNIRV
ncbi:MAG: crossover junction endodeoxyribonuclease RuvC [Oscillospiraceae bacterium]|nr:crossover junction endodeoxyribonuclease RuvC [Oscillospiraceae bacterium]